MGVFAKIARFLKQIIIYTHVKRANGMLQPVTVMPTIHHNLAEENMCPVV
jgi:hypothetical protein